MAKGIPTPSTIDLWFRKLPKTGYVRVGGKLIEAAQKAGKLTKDVFFRPGTPVPKMLAELAKKGVKIVFR